MTLSPGSNAEFLQGMQEVVPDDADLFRIESIATTPDIFDTGSAEEFTRFLCKGGAPRTFIEYDPKGNKVGYIALSALIHEECMEVRSIAVMPEYQHQGYGKMMMREAEGIANATGCSVMMLATSPSNTGAVRFYEALGYVITKEVADYYGDGTSRYVLEKQLSGLIFGA